MVNQLARESKELPGICIAHLRFPATLCCEYYSHTTDTEPRLSESKGLPEIAQLEYGTR